VESALLSAPNGASEGTAPTFLVCGIEPSVERTSLSPELSRSGKERQLGTKMQLRDAKDSRAVSVEGVILVLPSEGRHNP